MEKGNTVINAGPIDIAMSYRSEIMDDQGLCLQVYSEIDGKDTEILRFDCFDQAPHYHYGPENHNIRLFMDKTTAGNPLGWTIGNIRNSLPDMVRRSGYDKLADQLEAHPVDTAKLDEAEATAREMANGGRRTVHHMMPEMLDGDKVSVGNIKFGLEYRHLPQINDEGMAIHVLSDIAGQEVELLAFDCFQNGPHYHYGPRNQDVRIYWDVTTCRRDAGLDSGPVQAGQDQEHDQPRRLPHHRQRRGRGTAPVHAAGDRAPLLGVGCHEQRWQGRPQGPDHGRD